MHRDLAARNILLASKYQTKISDFGLSRWIGHTVHAQDNYAPQHCSAQNTTAHRPLHGGLTWRHPGWWGRRTTTERPRAAGGPSSGGCTCSSSCSSPPIALMLIWSPWLLITWSPHLLSAESHKHLSTCTVCWPGHISNLEFWHAPQFFLLQKYPKK